MSTIRIVLVDDVRAVVEEEKRFLEGRDVEIHTAADGTSALKKIKEVRPHAVFLDLNLPLMNGDVVCRAIKSVPDLSDTAVIMVSADDDEKSLQRCYACGADAYVIKPMSRKDMLEKLDLVLEELEFADAEEEADAPGADTGDRSP